MHTPAKIRSEKNVWRQSSVLKSVDDEDSALECSSLFRLNEIVDGCIVLSHGNHEIGLRPPGERGTNTFLRMYYRNPMIPSSLQNMGKDSVVLPPALGSLLSVCVLCRLDTFSYLCSDQLKEAENLEQRLHSFPSTSFLRVREGAHHDILPGIVIGIYFACQCFLIYVGTGRKEACPSRLSFASVREVFPTATHVCDVIHINDEIVVQIQAQKKDVITEVGFISLIHRNNNNEEDRTKTLFKDTERTEESALERNDIAWMKSSHHELIETGGLEDGNGLLARKINSGTESRDENIWEKDVDLMGVLRELESTQDKPSPWVEDHGEKKYVTDHGHVRERNLTEHDEEVMGSALLQKKIHQSIAIHKTSIHPSPYSKLVSRLSQKREKTSLSPRRYASSLGGEEKTDFPFAPNESSKNSSPTSSDAKRREILDLAERLRKQHTIEEI